MFRSTTVFIALVLALALPAAASARQSATRVNGPTGLRAFLLHYEEPISHDYSRTPSFGWKAVPKATSYEFQLATSDHFRENSILWSASGLKLPGTSVPLSLPWIRGNPYSLFARVRAKMEKGTTRWSDDFGLNVRWKDVPEQLTAPNGLLRWTPVDGATSYEVWAVNVPLPDGSLWTKTHYVNTNVTDTRDWYTFHTNVNWFGGVARWRVRAVRATYGTSLNGVTTTSYGRWSPVFQTTITPPGASTVTLGGTVADTFSTIGAPAPHALMPGFGFNVVPDPFRVNSELYRVYVFSDEKCVDPVMIGSLVGSPAWVPRASGALVLPRKSEDLHKAMYHELLKDGDQGVAFDVSGHELVTNESASTGARLDLWDRKWPSGAYYWTAVRASWYWDSEKDIVSYKDNELPQDACEAGRIGEFARVSQSVPTDGRVSFITGLSRTGRMISAKVSKAPRLWGTPLITWSPVLGAGGYEVQLSRTHNPFQSVASILSPVTSTVLTPGPGTWYYRVRGLNLYMSAGAQGMSWSTIRRVQIGKPSFRVLRRK